jgi:UDP-2-acetamido-2,6-beta-L-arabino-hexul-4-ose reductase
MIYVQELVDVIITEINQGVSKPDFIVEPSTTRKVSEVLTLLNKYKAEYSDRGEIPEIINSFEFNLFNTYRSYIDYKTHFPINFTQHIDPRGAFVEVIRLGIGGQCSFSTTGTGITRGNHYHTRKIERFAVIRGKALIQLRKIDTGEVLNFYLDGNEPAYVDIPIWYTHNIKNIGTEELYTIFWINETFNPVDSDTYFERVDLSINNT